MGMGMNVLRMTREGLRALPARHRVERGTLPARLERRVVLAVYPAGVIVRIQIPVVDL